MNGINRALRAGQKPPDGHSVWRWSWFDKSIEPAGQEMTQPGQPLLASSMGQEAATIAARRSAVRKAAEVAIAQLVAVGIEVDGRRLLYVSQLRNLAARIPHDISPEEVLTGAVARWLDGAPARRKVSAWSNIGDAIRREVADRANRKHAA